MKIFGWLRHRTAALGAGLVLAATSAVAAPVVVTEVGDAGDTLATAQVVLPAGEYNRLLQGSLSAEPNSLDYVDLYRFDMFGSILTLFTGAGNDPALVADPVIFLFDDSGMGLFMDDESGGFGQSYLQLLKTLTPGNYFVGIAFAGLEPVDAMGNPIFDTFGSGAVLSTGALAGWVGTPFAIDPGIAGGYALAVQIPNPGTLALSAAGLLMLLQASRRPQQRG